MSVSRSYRDIQVELDPFRLTPTRVSLPAAARIKLSIYGMLRPVSASRHCVDIRIGYGRWPLALMDECWPVGVKTRLSNFGKSIQGRIPSRCQVTIAGLDLSRLVLMDK